MACTTMHIAQFIRQLDVRVHVENAIKTQTIGKTVFEFVREKRKGVLAKEQ